MRNVKLLLAACLLLPLFGKAITSSDLPIIIINTHGQTIVDDPKIMADMGIIYNGPGVRNNMTDPFNHYNGKIGIEIRGQSSQMFPMKSYGIELWDASGNSVNRSLFGLPSESDWVLYAPYTDKTLMRNFLAYTLSNSMGHWAAHCRYVEVVVDGDYKGIYVLMEKIKRNTGRVNISKISTADISGDALTGGYIFSVDKEANGWFSKFINIPGSSVHTQFSYVYPKETSIASQQKVYLQNYVDSFETALFNVSYQDANIGWRAFAEENSFIDYVIVNELSRNVDGYRLSAYFYKDRASKGGRIVAGPVWDYDLAFRNADYCDGFRTNGWQYQFSNVCAGDSYQMPFWWPRLSGDTAFKSHLKCRWKQLRQQQLSQSNINAWIDSIVTLTSEARQRHFQRWPVLGQYIWPNPQPIPISYDGEISSLKNWIADRMAWIDANLANTGPCADYPADVNESMIVSFYPNPFRGTPVLTLRSRQAQEVTIEALDMGGKRLYFSRQALATGFNSVNVSGAGWPAGMYVLRITSSSGETFLRKIIKQ